MMSCKAMGFGAEIYVYGAMIAYGMGPGTIIGLVACPIYGGKILSDKIKLQWEENQLSRNQTTEKTKEIRANMKQIEQEMDHHIKVAKAFALGMIPLAGGYLALNYTVKEL